MEKHKQIIELIDKIDIESIDLGIDAFGFVYEDELSHSKGHEKMESISLIERFAII